MSRSKMVCFCGSTKFKNEYLQAAQEESLAGNIILMSGVFSQADGIELTEAQIWTLISVHREKIEMCDEVLVVNPGGCIGDSTASEIEYAEELGKPIRYRF